MSYLPCPGHNIQQDWCGRYGWIHGGSGHSFLTFTHTTRRLDNTHYQYCQYIILYNAYSNSHDLIKRQSIYNSVFLQVLICSVRLFLSLTIQKLIHLVKQLIYFSFPYIWWPEALYYSDRNFRKARNLEISHKW